MLTDWTCYFECVNIIFLKKLSLDDECAKPDFLKVQELTVQGCGTGSVCNSISDLYWGWDSSHGILGCDSGGC